MAWWLWWAVVGVVAAAGCSDSVESDPDGSGGGGDPCSCGQGAYTPVCGVDGKTYDATCGTECVPVDIECQGECPCSDCMTLVGQYAAQLALARACDPALDVEQCTQSVAGDLACQCPTFVNPANQDALAELAALVAEWDAARCGQAPCNCAEPSGALCQPD